MRVGVSVGLEVGLGESLGVSVGLEVGLGESGCECRFGGIHTGCRVFRDFCSVSSLGEHRGVVIDVQHCDGQSLRVRESSRVCHR